MKKIYFKTGGDTPGLPGPLKPWGCIGRSLLFLLLLLLLLFLLSLFRKCCHTGSGSGDSGESFAEKWNRPIADGPKVGLPPEEDNKLPPFDNPIPNPEDGGATEIYPNLLYVILDSESDDETFKLFAKSFTGLYPAPEHKIEYYNTGSKTVLLNVPEEKRIEICKALPEQISDVKFLVVPVEVLVGEAKGSVTPSDPGFKNADQSWYFSPIQAQEAWSITRGSRDVIVGIVDSYMDLNHPELSGDRSVAPYSVVRQDSDVSPEPGADDSSRGHGTLVTSIAVGNADNGAGVSGIAPNCSFIPVSMGTTINTVTMVEGLLYCMYNGADVINISAGSYWPDEIKDMPVADQISFSEEMGVAQEIMWNYVFDLAEKRKCTIVWSAGNQNCYDAMDSSKRNANTIRVSAVNQKLQKANFSNFGNFPSLDIYESTVSAPGVAIYNALPDDSYGAWEGTSFSAPIITGVVALLKSKNRDLTTAQIISILRRTGVPVKGSDEIGPIVQIKDALELAQKTVESGRTDDER